MSDSSKQKIVMIFIYILWPCGVWFSPHHAPRFSRLGTLPSSRGNTPRGNPVAEIVLLHQLRIGSINMMKKIISKNGWENFPKFRMGLVLIDFFTKYAVVVPIKPKSPSDVLVGMMEGIQKMGRKPKILFSDEESSFHKTRSHPAFAERFIRTFKEMFFKALSMTKKGETQYTVDRLYHWILLTWNDKTVHSATGLTPKQGREPKNEIKTQLNISQSN